MAMSARLRERVAYHEAGHAVAASRLHCAYRYVTIIPEEHVLGHVRYPKRPDGQLDALWDDQDLRRIERRIMVALAGLAAEAIRYGRRPPRWTQQPDVTTAIDLACRIIEPAANPRGPWACVEYLWHRTRGLLEAPLTWTSVEALAEVLLQSPQLSSHQARRIIQDARQDWARVAALIERGPQRMAAGDP